MRPKLVAVVILLFISVAAYADNGPVWRVNRPVPDEYIVVLADQKSPNVAAVAAQVTAARGGRVLVSLQYGTKMFGLHATREQAEAIARHPLVHHVEQNAYAFLSTTQLFTNDENWHLDRIDTHNLYPNALDRSYTYTSSGSGTYVYVLDNGVNGSHEQFGGRVEVGARWGDGYPANNPCGGVASLGHSHGTMVASIIAGSTNGVAKSATIIPVKVWSCDPSTNPPSGTSSTLWWCYGTSWALQDCQTRGICNRSVMNISGGVSVPLNQGTSCDGNDCVVAFENNIRALIAGGVTVVTSANNLNTVACDYTPARLGYGTYDPNSSEWWRSIPQRVITVGGTSYVGPYNAGTNASADTRYAASNYGPCVDIYAPAENYQRLAILGGTNTYLSSESGTSFSSALVAGVAARLRERFPYLTPSDVWATINSNATQNATCFNGTQSPCNNKLIYMSPND